MKLIIINKEGDICNLDVEPNVLIEKLKIMALGHFGAYLDSPTEKQRTLSRFRLLYIKQFRKLDELKSISEEGLIDEDELLLKKNPPIFYDEKKDYPLGPSINEIMVATASISIKPAPKPNSKTVSPNFQLEIRKVLLTLIQTSHSLICLNPESKHVFQILQTSQTLSQTPNLSGSNTAVNNPNYSNNNGDHTLNDGGIDAIANSAALRNLEEMGFNKKLAMRALIINRMDVSRATEWLLENSTSENITTGLPNSGTLSIPSSNNNNNNFMALNPIEIKTKIQSSTDPNAQCPTEKTVKNLGFNEDVLSPDNDIPRKIVMAFRAYKAKLYVPDPQAIANLREMGFEEQDILQALALCNNNEDAACEWLLQDSSGRQKTSVGKSMQLSNTTILGDMGNNSKQLTQEKGTTINNAEMDLEFQTLSPNSSLCRALLSDPTILLGLNNPKMFLILLNLYEMFIQTHALHIGHWFNDPDAAVLLSQIFRIYHSEKYSLLTQSQSQPVNSTSTSNDFSGNHSNNNNGNGGPNIQSDNLDGIDRSDMFFIPSTTSFESLSHNPFNPGESIGGDIPVVDYMLNEDGIDIDTDANGFSYDDEYDVHDYVNPDNPSNINNGDNSTSNFNFNNNNSNNLYENFRTTHGFINEFIIEGSGSEINSRNDDNYRRSNYRSPRLSHQNNDYIGRNAPPRSFNNNVIGGDPQHFNVISSTSSSSSEAIITQHGSNDYYNIRSPTLLHTTLASQQPYNLYHTSRLTSTNHRMGRDTLTRSENYLGSSLAPRRNMLGNNDNANNTENDSNETGLNKRISNPNPPHYSLMANNQNTSTDSINRSLVSLDPDYYDQNNFSNESSMITPSITMLITSNTTGGLSTAHMHYSNPKPLNLNLATATMSSLENVESRITPTWEERIGIGGNSLNRDGSSNSVSLNTLLLTTPTNTASKSSEMVNLTSEQGDETPLANTMDRDDINYSNPTLSDTLIEPSRTNEALNGKYRSILDSVPETHYHTIHSLFSSGSSKNSDNHHPSTLLLHKPPLSYNQSSLSNTISNPNPNLISYASTSVQDVGHTKKNEIDRKFNNSNSYSNGNNNFSVSANPLNESLSLSMARYPNYNTSQSYSSSALDSNRDTSTLNIRGDSSSYSNYSSNLSSSNYRHPYQLPHSSDLNISHNYESSRYPSVSYRRKYYPSSSENLDDTVGSQSSNRPFSTQTAYDSTSGRPNITVDSYSRSANINRGDSTEPHDLYSSYGSNRNYLSSAANHTLSTSSTTSYGYPYSNAISTSYQSYSSSRPTNNYVGSSRENTYSRNSSTTYSTNNSNNSSRNSANNSSYSQYLGPDSTYDSIYNRTRHWRY